MPVSKEFQYDPEVASTSNQDMVSVSVGTIPADLPDVIFKGDYEIPSNRHTQTLRVVLLADVRC